MWFLVSANKTIQFKPPKVWANLYFVKPKQYSENDFFAAIHFSYELSRLKVHLVTLEL
jgi:hypothetical protein